ncbi:Ger(x)C family spore germination protein [Bacillus salipaludis]|uniref:Ger(X)C family spore germination protein n=1 Tax=Bacillus salipaludis TaxID=2547811 RepID=A0A4R5VNJ2_9BACI|nr:Ger(x)C family spore germination protein [Bacillus salipaludis]MDQ6595828.1 Ger(x)C family spore germination protein [Bacillus salipaludis]TDK59837.1 Ger(x)C family spore germination protein [Bacillus salipaludis]
MQKIIRWFMVVYIPFFLTGCWDQRLLKEQKIIELIGYDVGSKGEVVASTSYPIGLGSSGNLTSSSTTSSKSTILTSRGETAGDSLLQEDLKISEKIDTSKTQVILFGERIAAKGLYQELDNIYRNPKGALGAKVAIVQGRAMDAIRLKQVEADLNGRYYDEFLKSGVATGFYTDYNVQSVCPLLLKHTKDPLLPLIKIHSKGNRAESVGMALFNNEKMTGKLTIPESKMFILLSGAIKQNVSFLVKTNHRYQQNQLNYVIVEILNSRPKTKLNVKNGAVTANLALKLQYRIREYPKNHLTSPLHLEQLNNEIKVGLTNTAKRTISKLQKANCDGFGIEEEIKVHHHRLWEGKYKNVAIKEIPIKVDLQLELLNSGIIN